MDLIKSNKNMLFQNQKFKYTVTTQKINKNHNLI